MNPKQTPATMVLAGGLHDFSRYENREPARIYRSEPLPLGGFIELDEALAEAKALAAYEVEMRWAARARAKGDKIRADHASRHAQRKLQRALKPAVCR